MSKRILLISDVQAPFHDRRAVKAVLRCVGDLQPDEVIQVGDLTDHPQPSRWNKGTVGEFEGSVFKDAETTKREFLGPLREVYDGPVGVHEGNHDERPRTYLAKYAPALAESDQFDMDKLMDFDGFGVRFLPEFYDVAPGWITTHGHRGGIRLTQKPGQTALGAAIKFGKSVAMGHTHRLAALPHTTGYGGKGSTVYGFEVGNLMDMKQATYLKGGTANWQQGFGLLTVDGSHVTPTAVPIHGGKFVVDGSVWKI